MINKKLLKALPTDKLQEAVNMYIAKQKSGELSVVCGNIACMDCPFVRRPGACNAHIPEEKVHRIFKKELVRRLKRVS